MTKTTKMEREEEANNIIEAFQTFDLNSDGVLEANEIRYLLDKLGVEFTDDELADVIKEGDCNGDGKICFEGKCIIFE